jgi:hypothetical protein
MRQRGGSAQARVSQWGLTLLAQLGRSDATEFHARRPRRTRWKPENEAWRLQLARGAR